MPKSYSKPTARNFIDLEGQRSGRLLVLAFRGMRDEKSWWLCRCDCGTRKVVEGYLLRSKRTKSCGCLQRERAADTGRASARPNSLRRQYPKEYRAWVSARQRCRDPQHHSYSEYGGRGITFSEEWDAFSDFLADVGLAPLRATLDRKDNNEGYRPGNCRWTSMRTQIRNRRNTLWLEYDGERRPLAEWAEIVGISYMTLRGRLRAGWAAWAILAIPVGEARYRLTSRERRKRLLARRRLQYAMKTGKVVRPDRCEDCNSSDGVQGHHHLGYDGDNVYRVRWLCSGCHTEAEQGQGGRREGCFRV